ncbi:hypothetical protein GALL_356730 [mine drainage metagenome]|uniref:Uncharacterized protein n=1 Tax=mine drainage metagenome TaxID=410659 RepID=A0A1J5QYL2_9ZZZZ
MGEFGKTISIKFLKDVDTQIAFSAKKHGCANRSEFMRLAVNHMLLSDGVDSAVDRIRSMLVNHDDQFERQSNELVQMVTLVGNRMEVVNESTQAIFLTVREQMEKSDSTFGPSINGFDIQSVERLEMMTKELASLALQVEQLTVTNATLVKALTQRIVKDD